MSKTPASALVSHWAGLIRSPLSALLLPRASLTRLAPRPLLPPSPLPSASSAPLSLSHSLCARPEHARQAVLESTHLADIVALLATDDVTGKRHAVRTILHLMSTGAPARPPVLCNFSPTHTHLLPLPRG